MKTNVRLHAVSPNGRRYRMVGIRELPRGVELCISNLRSVHAVAVLSDGQVAQIIKELQELLERSRDVESAEDALKG